MIEELPPNVLVDYVELRLRVRNGVVFGAKRLAQKMGCCVSRAHRTVASQVHHGLMRKDAFGNHVQIKSKDAIVRYAHKKRCGGPPTHKTTLLLKRNSTRVEIRDMLKLKLAERNARQFLWAKAQAAVFNTSHCLRSKIMRKGFNAGNIWQAPDSHPAIPLLELSAGEVSMTMKELAKSTMQSERSAYRWKRRMLGKGLRQRNRDAAILPEVSLSLDADPEATSALSKEWKGQLVRSRRAWRLVLPNAYVFTTIYTPRVKAKVAPKTKFQLVMEKLRDVENLRKQHLEKSMVESEWMAEALANPW